MKKKLITFLSIVLCLTMLTGVLSASALTMGELLPDEEEDALLAGGVYLVADGIVLMPNTFIPSGEPLNITFSAGVFGDEDDEEPFRELELTANDTIAVYRVDVTLQQVIELTQAGNPEASKKLLATEIYNGAANGTFVWQPADGFQLLILKLVTADHTIVTASFAYIGVKDLEEAGVLDAYPYAQYTGKPVELPHTVAFMLGGILRQGEDYTVSYKDNIEVGTATLTITGIGEYGGQLSMTFEIVKPAAVFTDVPAKAWYSDAVGYAKLYRLFEGTTKKTFAPDMKMSRAMFVSVLSRMTGVEMDNKKETEFSDVPKGKWYTGAVAWASEYGIVAGSNGKFMPDAPITREQICVILTGFNDYMGVTLKAVNAAVKFKDAKDISGWAKEAVRDMQVGGVMSGSTDGKFYPKKDATRAEVAQILKNYIGHYFNIYYDDANDELVFEPIYEALDR